MSAERRQSSNRRYIAESVFLYMAWRSAPQACGDIGSSRITQAAEFLPVPVLTNTTSGLNWGMVQLIRLGKEGAGTSD